MNNLIYLLAIATFFSTLIGGLIILKFKKSIQYFFAFAAGSIIAVAFLDLLPETLAIAEKVNIPVRTVMLVIVGAFFFYSLLEKYFASHSLEGEHGHSNLHDHHGHIMGPIGAGSLVIHSFLDGAAIGVAFQVNFAAGLIVALAVIFHDMTDGINTVAVMLKNKQSNKKAFAFLIMDAIAPVLGLILTSIIFIPETFLVYILAFFVGEFIYIGASTLLPETRHHPKKRIILAMLLGIILIAVLTGLL
ncbi:MAG: ZIP family metal transporter [Nanoarchaeota archaeon]